MEFILECFNGHRWDSTRQSGSYQFDADHCPQCKSIWSHVVDQISPITADQKRNFEMKMAAKAGE
jgi:Zn-finger nucleic acid-binding protein